MEQIPLSLDREGIKEREDGESGGGGGRLFQNISIKGGGAIIRGTAIIRGNTLVTRHN